MSWIVDLLKELPLSAVQKERLSLAEFQLAETDKALLTAEAALAQCRAEKVELQSLLAQAQVEIQQLAEQIAVIEREKQQDQAKTKELPHIDVLDYVQTQILRVIALRNPCSPDHVETELNSILESQGKPLLISSQVMHHLMWLSRFEEQYLRYLDRSNKYALHPRGSKYLEDNQQWPSRESHVE